MARRRKKKTVIPPQLLALAVVAGGLWLIINSAAQNAGAFGMLLFLVALIAVGIYWVVQGPKRRVREKVSQVVSDHIEALVRRRAQLVHRDAYGNVQVARWNKEVDAFIDNTIAPTLTARERLALNQQRQEIVRTISENVMRASDIYPVFQEFSENMTPAQFEVFCAEALRRQGWDATVTKGSRDQGVDVVAQKGGARIVLQCKLYGQPVGNKAVQEVVAARAHERAQFGAVVTNNQYTTPARELAATNSVWLLHHSDLARLDDLLQQRP